jgi:hypothetical protein
MSKDNCFCEENAVNLLAGNLIMNVAGNLIMNGVLQCVI